MCQNHHRDERSEPPHRPAKRTCNGCGACQRGERCPLLDAAKALVEPVRAVTGPTTHHAPLPPDAPRAVLAF